MKRGTYEDEEWKRERSSFKNYSYARSLISDHINNKSQMNNNEVSKFLGAFALTLLFYGVSIGASFGLFYLKRYFVEQFINSSALILMHNLVNLIDVIKILVMDWLYAKMAVRFVNWIDPKYMQQFEKYLITLIVFFSLLNNYFVLIVIVFFKKTL